MGRDQLSAALQPNGGKATQQGDAVRPARDGHQDSHVTPDLRRPDADQLLQEEGRFGHIQEP